MAKTTENKFKFVILDDSFDCVVGVGVTQEFAFKDLRKETDMLLDMAPGDTRKLPLYERVGNIEITLNEFTFTVKKS